MSQERWSLSGCNATRRSGPRRNHGSRTLLPAQCWSTAWRQGFQAGIVVPHPPHLPALAQPEPHLESPRRTRSAASAKYVNRAPKPTQHSRQTVKVPESPCSSICCRCTSICAGVCLGTYPGSLKAVRASSAAVTPVSSTPARTTAQCSLGATSSKKGMVGPRMSPNVQTLQGQSGPGWQVNGHKPGLPRHLQRQGRQQQVSEGTIP